jgi:hypothetical protein
MTKQVKQDHVNESNAQEDVVTNSDVNQEQEDQQKKISNQIPKKRFDEVNEKYKAASKELEAFKSAQEEANNKKLEEQGKFQELLTLRDKELNDAKLALEGEKKNNKLEKLKNKSLSLLNKEGIIDGDDGLRFLKFDEVMDSESPDDVLKNMVGQLKESKSYLFGSTKRKSDENGMPSSGSQTNAVGTPRNAYSKAFQKFRAGN